MIKRYYSTYFEILDFFKVIRKKIYRSNLWKAIKGQRWIDYDYFNRSFDEHMVTALKELMITQKDKVITKYNTEDIIKLCDQYLDNLYEYTDESVKLIKESQKKIGEFIKKYLPNLRR